MPDFDYGTLLWLRGLAHARIRRNERGLARFAPKPGQSEEEAAEVRAHYARNLEWQQGVLRQIDALLADAKRNRKTETPRPA